jgi:hypothetical protein
VSESILPDVVAELRRKSDLRADLIADGLWASARLVWLLDTEMFDHLDDDEHGHWMRQVRLVARDVRATFGHLEDIE